MIQTGIQACPIQALPIIFLGSSYRKRTWIFYPIHLNPCKICFIFSPHLFSHQSPHHRGSSSALACNIPSMNLRPISKPNHCKEDTRAAKLHWNCVQNRQRLAKYDNAVSCYLWPSPIYCLLPPWNGDHLCFRFHIGRSFWSFYLVHRRTLAILSRLQFKSSNPGKQRVSALQ